MPPVSGSRQKLMAAALGRLPADLVIKNADIFNVWTRSVQKNMMAVVLEDRIAHVGPMDEFDGINTTSSTTILDAGNRILIPGFIDSHTHLAWLVKPHEYVPHILPRGCTTIITETMEIYPVAGVNGVKDYIAALDKLPMRFYTTLPAMATISRAGMGLPQGDARELAALPSMVGVGESYWQTVFQHPDSFLPLFDRTLATGGLLEGHSAGASGRKLSAYGAVGITSCHEAITAAQVLERLEKGFHVQIREGSIRSELPAVASIAAENLDLSNISLVSDGITPRDLIAGGYMDTIVQQAIDTGFRPEDAVCMATLNPARHFRLDHDIGSIAPGRFADMVLIPDLGTIRPEIVIAAGKVAGENLSLKVQAPAHEFSAASLDTLGLPSDITGASLAVPSPESQGHVPVRTMEFVTDLVTRESVCSLPVSEGRVQADPDQDVIKAAAADRAKTPGKMFTGFVKGFGLKQGAVASSAGWDGSEIIVLGADDRDIALAVNQIRKDRGGIVLALDGNILKSFPLPVFGILSNVSLKEAAKEISEIIKEIQGLGCPFEDPLLSLSTLTGAAIPFLRICNEGLVDFKTGERKRLFPENGGTQTEKQE